MTGVSSAFFAEPSILEFGYQEGMIRRFVEGPGLRVDPGIHAFFCQRFRRQDIVDSPAHFPLQGIGNPVVPEGEVPTIGHVFPENIHQTPVQKLLHDALLIGMKPHLSPKPFRIKDILRFQRTLKSPAIKSGSSGL